MNLPGILVGAIAAGCNGNVGAAVVLPKDAFGTLLAVVTGFGLPMGVGAWLAVVGGGAGPALGPVPNCH